MQNRCALLNVLRTCCALLLAVFTVVSNRAYAQAELPSAEVDPGITHAVTTMLHALDAREWSRVRAAFTDRVYVDLGPIPLLGGAPGTQAADTLVERWRRVLPGFDATQHVTGPCIAETERRDEREAAEVRADLRRAYAPEDYARARCAIIAMHRLGDFRTGGVWTVGGHYQLEFRRSRGVWLISALRLEPAYVMGDASLPRQAQERVAAQ